MKKKDLINIKNKSIAELEKMAADTNNQLARAKMEITMHKSKNTNVAKNLKRTLAQVLTIKREQELYESEKGEVRREK